jgi:hypothetical protein
VAFEVGRRVEPAEGKVFELADDRRARRARLGLVRVDVAQPVGRRPDVLA